MSLKCGIIGLANRGKSTLFNALTSSYTAKTANYPFCTIEPNNGIAQVYDTRLDTLSDLSCSLKKVHAFIEFVDIAGLVKGAHHGEGLGNKFLAHIREVNAVVVVLPCFSDVHTVNTGNDIVHPIDDLDILSLELKFADIGLLDNMIANSKKHNTSNRYNQARHDMLVDIRDSLSYEKDHKDEIISRYGQTELHNLGLLSFKPALYVCNVLEHDINGNHLTQDAANALPIAPIIISAKIEADIANLDAAYRQEFLSNIGLAESRLTQIVHGIRTLLNLSDFFTTGAKETRAWTFKNGMNAKQAAGIIHSDFERYFICAEIIKYHDMLLYQSRINARNNGKARLEGESYIVQDGDVIDFRFNKTSANKVHGKLNSL